MFRNSSHRMRLEQLIQQYRIGRRTCGRDSCHFGNDNHGAGNARGGDDHCRHAGSDYDDEYDCHGAANARGHDYHCRHAAKTGNHHDRCHDYGAGKTGDDGNTNRPDAGRGDERSRHPAHRDQ
jgi:hypothetical protein